LEAKKRAEYQRYLPNQILAKPKYTGIIFNKHATDIKYVKKVIDGCMGSLQKEK